MPIKANIGAINWKEENVRGAGMWPAIVLGQMVAAQGVLPVGLLLTLTSLGYVPYLAVDNEAIAVGTGALKDFTATLAKLPVEPGSLLVTDGVETFIDDGLGRLVGSAGGTGTIYYATGTLALSFNANVGNGAQILADYETALDAVLVDEIDTAASTAAAVILCGPVTEGVLKVGAVAKAAPSAALLQRLQRKRIFAV